MLAKLEALERGFYGVQTRAMSAIPEALAELDVRLQHALAEALPHQPRLARRRRWSASSPVSRRVFIRGSEKVTSVRSRPSQVMG